MYGGRWQNLGRDIGGVGQGVILRVCDTSDPSKTEYALKRLKKSERNARFLLEIEALSKINHPNVIKIIDHFKASSDGDTEVYWFVMPLALGNLEERIGLYKGNLDAVVRVASQFADALVAAHAQGFVHRDVKPANILFPRMDHDVWLSDFGICHLDTAERRLTEIGEVVGPRGFTAPELETGGQVPVTGAADLYSLGKVIYYMLSGGCIIAREQLGAPDYIDAFAKSQRHGLLQTLLSRMIAPLDRRIKLASEVREELRRIEQWEEHALTLALTPETLASIDAAQRKATDQVRIQSENRAIRESERALINTVSASIMAWLKGEMQKTASLIEQGGTHKAEISKATWVPDQTFRFQTGPAEGYFEVDGLQLSFHNFTTTFKPKFVLKFFLCQAHGGIILLGNTERPIKASDPQLALVPYIVEMPEPYGSWFSGGFLKSKTALIKAHADLARRMGNRNRPFPANEPIIAKTFVGEPINLLVKFKASEWPSVLDKVKELFSEAVKIVVDFSATDQRFTGN
jgi:serine/threonine protein kinase